MKQEEAIKREITYKIIDDENMPPIMITIEGETDLPKVVINRHYTIWLSLYRKCIGGCAESLFDKINEMLSSHLSEQRMFERMN